MMRQIGLSGAKRAFRACVLAGAAMLVAACATGAPAPDVAPPTLSPPSAGRAEPTPPVAVPDPPAGESPKPGDLVGPSTSPPVALPDAPLPEPVKAGEQTSIGGVTVTFGGIHPESAECVAVLEVRRGKIEDPTPLVSPSGLRVEMRVRGDTLVSESLGHAPCSQVPERLFWKVGDSVVVLQTRR